ncbi:hypothetical protein BJV77DRAFT_1059472 [Russula vinacea]|nr:hypothetical protein BJV77DRAFT_1059472 [Russula vinacea]
MENIPIDMSIHSDTTGLLREMDLVYQSITSYQPTITNPPILDSSAGAPAHQDGQHLYGLRPFLEAVKRDLDVVKQFLADPDAALLPPPSTNAPYLIAVWKEVLSSPLPIIAIGKTFYERSQVTTDGEGKKQARTQSSGKSTGVKIDVVGDNGHTWTRVNTAKNSRLLAEFRELDSYLTDSDGEDGASGDMACSSLPQTEFDNSLLRAGRALLAAARDNPVLGTNTPPEIVFRLTRIDPDATDESGNDPRIARTIESLRNMGLIIKLGERGTIEQLVDSAPVLPSPPVLIPTLQINLDLSILIALVSDLAHAPLPESVDVAHERFIPSAAYVEWKRSRLRAKGVREHTDDPLDPTQHSRALVEQLQQEMHRGIFQEIHERLFTCRRQLRPDDPTHIPASSPEDAPPLVEFWTTPEARDRFLRIVAKVGGPAERRRARALFPTSSVDGGVPPSLSEQETQYWIDSRHRRGFLPYHPSEYSPPPNPHCPRTARNPRGTCRALLAAGGAPHPRATMVSDEIAGEGEEIQRASVVRSNSRLTTHTVQSMLCGAACGQTTLTANRASVRAMLREMKMHGYGVYARGGGAGAEKHAALWVLDPRSLAEGMRSDVVSSSPAPV